ncbi:DUF4245 domain-containing protein [Blastococcus montanus]|uniref:DUF4245 domain-containing protein n=1 Tax=Blastococcus montanus TaxID=3144973 RepID=UPI0032079CA6
MTGNGPTSQRPEHPRDAAAADELPPPSPAVVRANRMSAANMIRSLLPLVLICLAIVGWQAFRANPDDPILEIDPTNTLQLADVRADYPLLVPDPGDGFRPTSARTDAGNAGEGDPVSVQLGYVTPSERYAAFVVSDDPEAESVRAILDGAVADGSVEVDGQEWTRSTTQSGETALSRVADGLTLVVTGSAGEQELRTLAGSVEPYSG